MCIIILKIIYGFLKSGGSDFFPSNTGKTAEACGVSVRTIKCVTVEAKQSSSQSEAPGPSFTSPRK